MSLACTRCSGLGHRTYPSTATWLGGIGGSMLTPDLCDRCWGSGDEAAPFQNLKALYTRFNGLLAIAQDTTLRNPRVAKLWTALEQIKLKATEAERHSPMSVIADIAALATTALESK